MMIGRLAEDDEDDIDESVKHVPQAVGKDATRLLEKLLVHGSEVGQARRKVLDLYSHPTTPTSRVPNTSRVLNTCKRSRDRVPDTSRVLDTGRQQLRLPKLDSCPGSILDLRCEP